MASEERGVAGEVRWRKMQESLLGQGEDVEMQNTKEVIDVLESLSMNLQTASDRAYLLCVRDGYSPAYISERVRAEIILPLKEFLAQAEKLEGKINQYYDLFV